MKGWNQFGVIDTIYEEEQEISSPSFSSLSSFSSSPPSLLSRVKAWSLDTGHGTDILIRVQGTCFHLHKDRMISRSSYLKRHLTEVSDFTLSPPLNITAETFAAIAEYCYSHKAPLTPTNVAAIRTAAELLGMKGEQDGENLCHVSESYFCRIIGIGQEYASMVLRSCLPLLPDAETTASLFSKCIEALVWENEDVFNVDATTCLNDVVGMNTQDFLTVVDSMNPRLSNHDVLYQMVDLYLQDNKYNGKLSEEQKTQLCNTINCSKLSQRTLVECVQNPRMPLRFIVRAMLIEHLNTRNSIATAATGPHQVERTTLREFLHRDTAHRQTAQLKEAIDSTYSRIQSLENELTSMKKILVDHHAKGEDQEQEEEEQQQQQLRNVLNSERCASFHSVTGENGKVVRGERGSVSSSGFMFDTTRKGNEVGRSSLSVGTCHNQNGTPRMNKTFRQRLITGLKNAFRVSNSASNST
ncbi:hypothetical protein Lal_00007604 [Lupinus albus]|uniref:Putative SKP1/BTB/POZ domain, NPH3 domain-containing protein n=1 Tax=Lupinus albus TaxID=3870 RepID=A0A6A5MR19_LUPAL|nr:putative SKP1/BTB/POZ domain, NPH3 domain-containing protein [Lupinus albus]KAF1874988.1 hypothetical protein Lal_00007604 [Lupinus albus]